MPDNTKPFIPWILWILRSPENQETNGINLSLSMKTQESECQCLRAGEDAGLSSGREQIWPSSAFSFYSRLQKIEQYPPSTGKGDLYSVSWFKS